MKRTGSNLLGVKEKVLICILSILIAFVALRIGILVQGRWGDDASNRWGGLVCFTLALFALFVAESERFLRRWRFWGVTATLLMGHVAGFAIVLTHVETWRLIWFMVMALEYPLFLVVRDRFVSPRTKLSSGDDPGS